MLTTIRQAALITGALVWGSAAASGQDSVATLRGMIVDSATGDAVGGALVYLDDSPLESMTDRNGSFRLGPIAQGQYQLTVMQDGYQPRGFAFTITSQLLHEIDVGVMSLAPLPRRLIALRGTVRDVNSGNPLKDVVVTVNGEIQTETESDGRFDISGYEVTDGAQAMFVRKIGYESITYPVNVTADQTVFDLDLRIQPLPRRLDDIVVEGRPVSRKLTDFFTRRSLGDGEYLAPWELEELPAQNVTDYLKTMRGVLVTPGRYFDSVRLSRGCRTPPRIFVDGVEVRNTTGVGRIVSHLEVAAIEVYNAVSKTPLQFQRNTRTDGCGTILIWTR